MPWWWRSQPALLRAPPQPRSPSTTSTAATTIHSTVTSLQPARPSASASTWPWCASSTSSAPWSMISRPRRPTSSWAATPPARPPRHPPSRPGRIATSGHRTSAAAPVEAWMGRAAAEPRLWRAREEWVEDQEGEPQMLVVYLQTDLHRAWTRWEEGNREDAAPSDAQKDAPPR